MTNQTENLTFERIEVGDRVGIRTSTSWGTNTVRMGTVTKKSATTVLVQPDDSEDTRRFTTRLIEWGTGTFGARLISEETHLANAARQQAAFDTTRTEVQEKLAALVEAVGHTASRSELAAVLAEAQLDDMVRSARRAY